MSTGTARIAAVAVSFIWGAMPGPVCADVLRTVRDAAHGRVWILERDAVYVQDNTGRTARYELPDWAHAGEAYACPPDLALDARGAAVVSSNVLPVLWRIDPSSAEVAKHELALDSDTDKDVGFSSLRYSRKSGAFVGVSSIYGSQWRIDPSLRRATKVQESASTAAGDSSFRRGTTCAAR